jgi:hypothetical protein
VLASDTTQHQFTAIGDRLRCNVAQAGPLPLTCCPFEHPASLRNKYSLSLLPRNWPHLLLLWLHIIACACALLLLLQQQQSSLPLRVKPQARTSTAARPLDPAKHNSAVQLLLRHRSAYSALPLRPEAVAKLSEGCECPGCCSIACRWRRSKLKHLLQRVLSALHLSYLHFQVLALEVDSDALGDGNWLHANS